MAINRCCRNVIVDTILNIIPLDPCPPIIQTVNDISLAVDGTAVGQLTVERYIEGDGTQHIHLYEWDGANWILLIDSSARVVDSLISGFDCPILTGWEFSLDEGLTWHIEGIVLDPPVSSITVWFRNTLNGCVYTNLPIIPLVYCGTNYGIFTDILLAPSGFAVGDVAMVSFLDSGGTDLEYRSIYEWDGASWVMMVETVTIPPQNSSIPNPSVSYIDPTWLISYDSGATWGIDSYPNIPAVSSLPIWYKNSNDCIYQNNPST